MKLSTVMPFVFEEEAVSGAGEDSYFVRCLDEGLVVMGVFDGCGGIGGRRYPSLQNRTGAWIGSQVAACTADAFVKTGRFSFDNGNTELFREFMSEKLGAFKAKLTQNTGVQIGGTLNKSLPTTVSIIASQPSPSGGLLCKYIWAGDSRGFFLDKDGLCQLTEDDIDSNSDDAYLNLREDGILTNVANGDRRFTLHSGTIELSEPSMLISATDGCFAYFLTPMDFENVILAALSEAADPTEWHSLLCSRIKAVTGDDYTMTIACFGFDSFGQLKEHFLGRSRLIANDYISRQDMNDEPGLQKLWESYKTSYYRRKLDLEC